ncbi:MAG: helix-turn-helix domain-containing protein [Planctomycetes bacterium]|nr:helix-turn-helix domain-containing protein [Planctomycetota bacterium]
MTDDSATTGTENFTRGDFTLEEGALLTVPQALALLPVGKSLLYDLAAKGRIQTVRIGSCGSRGGRILVVRASLEALVREQLEAAAAPRKAPRLDLDGIVARHRGAA